MVEICGDLVLEILEETCIFDRIELQLHLWSFVSYVYAMQIVVLDDIGSMLLNTMFVGACCVFVVEVSTQ